jgi:hypothetical protein
MMKISHEAMVNNFTTYQNETSMALTHIKGLLEREEYQEATAAMEIVSKRMAQTAVAMRSVMIRGGYIGETP